MSVTEGCSACGEPGAAVHSRTEHESGLPSEQPPPSVTAFSPSPVEISASVQEICLDLFPPPQSGCCDINAGSRLGVSVGLVRV